MIMVEKEADQIKKRTTQQTFRWRRRNINKACFFSIIWRGHDWWLFKKPRRRYSPHLYLNLPRAPATSSETLLVINISRTFLSTKPWNSGIDVFLYFCAYRTRWYFASKSVRDINYGDKTQKKYYMQNPNVVFFLRSIIVLGKNSCPTSSSACCLYAVCRLLVIQGSSRWRKAM